MGEQIVYVCGCEGDGAAWDANDMPYAAERGCPRCNQPIRAVNLTRLEAVVLYAQHVVDSAQVLDDGEVDVSPGDMTDLKNALAKLREAETKHATKKEKT